MWITTFIMFAVSTCHFVLRWGRLMRTIMNDFEDSSDNGITVELASFMNLYIPAINVSHLNYGSIMLTLMNCFAVPFERWNCTLEGMDHVGTQRESLDFLCAIFSGIRR